MADTILDALASITRERDEAREEIERLRKPNRDAMANRSEDEWEALEEAVMTVYGLQAGHVLTEDDIAALHLVDQCHREDEDGATEAYNKGREEGLRERGGDELVKLNETIDSLQVQRATERTMKLLAQDRATKAEAERDAMREGLKPFAELAEYYRIGGPLRARTGPIMAVTDHRIGEREITVEHLLAAAALVNGEGG
jgi:choline dehydrogenase-like flavoprotein